MSVYFFWKKILGGKHQSKKFRLQICNLVNINKKVWSLLIGKNMHGNNPMYEKNIWLDFSFRIHQHWSAAVWCVRENILLWWKKCFLIKWCSCRIHLLDFATHFELVCSPRVLHSCKKNVRLAKASCIICYI